ncbi:MAG: hypothetical protein QM499_06550 [Flavobacteriaceae bacterium]
MKVLSLILLFISISGYTQPTYENPLKFEGQLRGVFEVLAIDSTKSVNLITLKLNYLTNKSPKLIIPPNYIALVFSDKPSKEKNRKNQKIGKSQWRSTSENLLVGKEYYFDLKHYYYYRSINPPPNNIPYAFDLDGERIWEESDTFGIYQTSYLEGVFYVIDKYVKETHF